MHKSLSFIKHHKTEWDGNFNVASSHLILYMMKLMLKERKGFSKFILLMISKSRNRAKI